jgi:hypothetical protein
MAIRAKQLEFLKKTTVQRIGEFNAARDEARQKAAPFTVSAKKRAHK